MRTFKILDHVAQMYSGTDMHAVLILACQHLLEPQQKMFSLLLKLGLSPDNLIIIGKGYSTNTDVMHHLMEMGCIVAPFSDSFDPLRNFDEWFKERLDEYLKLVLSERNLLKYRKIIILDDGGFIHAAIQNVTHMRENIVGIEQTSSGHHRIRALNLPFPTISVARSYQKLTYEAPLIGDDGAWRISLHIRKRKKVDPNILVVGLGPIGRQIAGQLFFNYRFRMCATDAKDMRVMENMSPGSVGAVQLLEFNRLIIPIEEMDNRLSEFDIIVGCTGNSVFKTPQIERLHTNISLISMSSSDREFPAIFFRKTKRSIHDDYYVGNRCLVNGGFPITFDGKLNALHPHKIEFTIALLFIRIMDELSSGMHPGEYVVAQAQAIWNDY